MKQRVCESVGTFVLYQHCQKIDKKDISLNGDDGLVVHTNISRPKLVKIKKNVSNFISSKWSKNRISIQYANNWLSRGLTWNLSCFYQPFPQSNDRIINIYKEFDHLPPSTKQLPLLIKSKLSNLPCQEKLFKKHFPKNSSKIRIKVQFYLSKNLR